MESIGWMKYAYVIVMGIFLLMTWLHYRMAERIVSDLKKKHKKELKRIMAWFKTKHPKYASWQFFAVDWIIIINPKMLPKSDRPEACKIAWTWWVSIVCILAIIAIEAVTIIRYI